MIQSDEQWLAVVDAFQAAAVTGASWYSALHSLAHATGSRCGQLIGLGSANTVPFNWTTDLGPEWVEEFIADGGADPAINPVVRFGASIPELKIATSGEFITPEERRRNRFIVGHVNRYDIHHVCLTPLVREEGMLIGLAVLRSKRQGEISRRERAVFASLAPHVRAAVRTQIALEHQGAKLLAGAMEALSMPAFVCDGNGRVRALTPAAEALVAGRTGLRLREGRLHAFHSHDDTTLSQAIDRAIAGLRRPGPPAVQTVVVHGARGAAPLALEVVALPSAQFHFGFVPRVLVIAPRREDPSERRAAILRAAYGLTPAETEVALRLAAGNTAERISANRNVALGTVRVQIKAILRKLNVRRQVELVAAINKL
ncbi:MAG TPA: LuxR C-terminal-related transcriptional regulator [Burkholderiales bacterium]